MSAVLVTSPKFHKGVTWHDQEDQTPDESAVTLNVELQTLANERSLHAHALLVCSSRQLRGTYCWGFSASNGLTCCPERTVARLRVFEINQEISETLPVYLLFACMRDLERDLQNTTVVLHKYWMIVRSKELSIFVWRSDRTIEWSQQNISQYQRTSELQ